MFRNYEDFGGVIRMKSKEGKNGRYSDWDKEDRVEYGDNKARKTREKQKARRMKRKLWEQNDE